MWIVRWVRSAVDDLADIWIAAEGTDRQAITLATNEIDRRLQADPENAGESRPNGRRILLVPPLGVTYQVLKDRQIVRVLDVWRFQTRSQ
jgi:hypothetical protein